MIDRAKTFGKLSLFAALTMIGLSPGAGAQAATPGATQAPPAQAGTPATPQPGPQPSRRRATLREALQLAAKQGPDVAAARAQAAITAVSVERAWTTWQPDILATGTLDHTSAPSSIQFQGKTITIVGENSRYGLLQISQPFLSPQGLFLPGVASAAAEAANRGADEAREQVLLSVARAYLGLQGLEGLVQAAKDAERVALARENDAKAQIAAGTAVEIALLRAQTETAQARVQLANLEGQRESLLPLLEALTGESIEPVPAGAAEDLGPAGRAEEQPWENAFSVRSAASQVVSLHRSTNLDRFLWMPTVAGIAKGNYTSNGGFAGVNTTYDLILSVSVPLYDRGVRYAQLHEDEAKLSQAQANLEASRAKARSNWLGAVANYQSAQVAQQQAEVQEQLATRTQQQVEASYKAGVSTSLDLSDADNKKFSAQSAAAQARANTQIRRAEVAAAEGKLYNAVAK